MQEYLREAPSIINDGAYPRAFMSTVAEQQKGDFGYIDQVDRIEPYVAERQVEWPSPARKR